MGALIPRYRIVHGEIRHVAGFDFEPDSAFLNRLLRKKQQTIESATAQQLIDMMAQRARELIQPAALYGIFPVDPTIGQWFPQCRSLALALVTIGPDLEQKVSELGNSNRIAESVVLDAFGSAMVEGAVKAVDKVLRLEAKITGLISSKRRSPGYPPWQLADQKKVLAYLGGHRINVSLLEDYLMQPRKTVSFGIALT